MSRLTVEHLWCVQGILRYVIGTNDKALLYRTGVAEGLLGYTNVDWAWTTNDRRSTSGFEFYLGSVTITLSS